MAFIRLNFAGQVVSEYDAAGRGTYTYLSDPASLATVRMIGRPAIAEAISLGRAYFVL